MDCSRFDTKKAAFSGKLYICPTPIGNMEDITLRVLRILSEVDIIAAEDTRRTVKLLNHYEISKKMICYREHNKNKAGERLIEIIEAGGSVALVTDAGMPGISDPGVDIIKTVSDRGLDFEVLPGACAVVNALVGSTFSTDEFIFLGFLGRNAKSIREKLSPYSSLNATIVFYEAPHRLVKTLKTVYEVLGDRNASVCRELTKKHEEYIRMSLSRLISRYEEKDDTPRGEMVIVVGGNGNAACDLKAKKEEIGSVEYDEIKKIFEGTESSKAAADIIRERFGLSKNGAYEMMLKWKDRLRDE